MMKNIFDNAYFGKPYKMKNGNKAIFHRNANNRTWYLICEEIHDRIPYDSNGVCRGDNCFDIVSEYQEETTNNTMTKEEVIKVVNNRIEYFKNGNEREFITNKEYDDMRYALSKVIEDINNLD